MNAQVETSSEKNADEDRRYCYDHHVWFSIKKGCDNCRKVGYCPYYGRGCPC